MFCALRLRGHHANRENELDHDRQARQQKIGGEVLITADHGNAEMMHDDTTHQAHTAHTLNVVPLLYIGRKAHAAAGGALQDVAPTLLRMMGLPQPPEMTGKPLIDFV